MSLSRAALSACALAMLAGCSDDTFTAPDRAAGTRAPLTSACDPADPLRCHLPWPSSRFTTVDATTATGLRLKLDPSTYASDDDAASLEQADGFSRISPILVGTEGLLEAPLGDDAIRVWVNDPDHPRHGDEVALRVHVELDDSLEESLVVAHPRRPMAENASHTAIAMRAPGLEANETTRIALGLLEPRNQAEADLRGYHAPTRAFLQSQGVAFGDVARVWDFVTRSQAPVVAPLLELREAARAAVGSATLSVDDVQIATKPGVAMIVEGKVEFPYYAVTDALPDPSATATHQAPFRVLVPEGTGDYPVVLFGHGLGGTFDDPAFDEALAAEGLGKLGVDFHGWTEPTFINTLGGFIRPYAGSVHASGMMLQALAELSALQLALDGPLGDLLAADMIGGVANPAAGRRPDMTTPMYGGGSLGGSVGYIYANMEPTIRYAALNVGGGGWSHFLRPSVFFAPLAALMQIDFGSGLDVTLVVAQAQTNLDYIDGAAWADHREDRPVLLMQESVGDRVLPNIGTELMAVSSDAVRVGKPIDGFELEEVPSATEQTALTQFQVTSDDAGVHGFAITDTPAGDAARDQIRRFFATAQAGEARIEIPAGCPGGLCDFAEDGGP